MTWIKAAPDIFGEVGCLRRPREADRNRPKWLSLKKEDRMIEQLKGFPDNVLAFACREQVTRRDYESVLVPAVEAALKGRDKVRLYYETGPDFTGIEAGAVLEDIKVGIEHLGRWERLALVSDVEWIRTTVRAFGFLLPGHLKVFRLGEAAAARAWVAEA